MEFSEFRLTLIEKPHECKHTRSSWLRGKEKGNTDRYWKEQFLHAWERTLHDLADDAGLNTARVAAGACAGASRAARGRRPQCCHLQGLRGAARSSPRSRGAESAQDLQPPHQPECAPGPYRVSMLLPLDTTVLKHVSKYYF